MTGHWGPVGSCSFPGVLSNRGKKGLKCLSFVFFFYYSDQQLLLNIYLTFTEHFPRTRQVQPFQPYLVKQTQVTLLSVPCCSQGKNPNHRFDALTFRLQSHQELGLPLSSETSQRRKAGARLVGFCFVFRGNGLFCFAAMVSCNSAEGFLFSVKKRKQNESPFPVKEDTTLGLGD